MDVTIKTGNTSVKAGTCPCEAILEARTYARFSGRFPHQFSNTYTRGNLESQAHPASITSEYAFKQDAQVIVEVPHSLRNTDLPSYGQSGRASCCGFQNITNQEDRARQGHPTCKLWVARLLVLF